MKKAIEGPPLGRGGVRLLGGREGYDTLLNTDMRQEEHLRLLHLAVEHKQALGSRRAVLHRAKPCEPSTHQYDYDASPAMRSC